MSSVIRAFPGSNGTATSDWRVSRAVRMTISRGMDHVGTVIGPSVGYLEALWARHAMACELRDEGGPEVTSFICANWRTPQ